METIIYNNSNNFFNLKIKKSTGIFAILRTTEFVFPEKKLT